MLCYKLANDFNPYSPVASSYALARPLYPESFFELLRKTCTNFDCAWDCATGNGQIARDLIPLFKKIIASDISQAQLKQAQPSPQIEYVCTPAEKTPFADRQFDLITVGQALHWLNLDDFYAEAKRTLKPAGLIAVINYRFIPTIDQPVDELLNDLAKNILKDDWPPQAWSLSEPFAYPYGNYEFPFNNVQNQKMQHVDAWSRRKLLAYLKTWSGTQNFIHRTGLDPLQDFERKLEKCWPESIRKKLAHWHYLARIGHNP